MQLQKVSELIDPGTGQEQKSCFPTNSTQNWLGVVTARLMRAAPSACVAHTCWSAGLTGTTSQPSRVMHTQCCKRAVVHWMCGCFFAEVLRRTTLWCQVIVCSAQPRGVPCDLSLLQALRRTVLHRSTIPHCRLVRQAPVGQKWPHQQHQLPSIPQQ